MSAKERFEQIEARAEAAGQDAVNRNADENFRYSAKSGILYAEARKLCYELESAQIKADAYDELTKVLRQWADDADPETDEKIWEALERAHTVGNRKEVEVEA